MKLKKTVPTLSVANVAETVSFYQNTLGFSLEVCVGVDMDTLDTEMIDGETYVHATVFRNEVSFTFLVDEYFKFEIPYLEDCSRGGSVLFYIDVDDIAHAYKELEDKVEVVKPLETTWYGVREFFIRDNNGYILGFSEQL